MSPNPLVSYLVYIEMYPVLQIMSFRAGFWNQDPIKYDFVFSYGLLNDCSDSDAQQTIQVQARVQQAVSIRE